MNNEYPAVIKQDGEWWIGWIEEVAGEALEQFVLTVNPELHITDWLFVIDNRFCV
jgi:hypothetical protein